MGRPNDSDVMIDEFIKDIKPTPKWKKSPSEIGSDIAGDFYPVTSLSHADLRRQIVLAIEAEREVTRHYMTQMGRFWLGKNP